MQLEGRRGQEGLLPCALWFPPGNQPAFLEEAAGLGHGPYTTLLRASLLSKFCPLHLLFLE